MSSIAHYFSFSKLFNLSISKLKVFVICWIYEFLSSVYKDNFSYTFPKSVRLCLFKSSSYLYFSRSAWCNEALWFYSASNNFCFKSSYYFCFLCCSVFFSSLTSSNSKLISFWLKWSCSLSKLSSLINFLAWLSWEDKS